MLTTWLHLGDQVDEQNLRKGVESIELKTRTAFCNMTFD